MRALLYETRTGDPIRDIECSEWECDTGVLAPDKGSVTIPAYTPNAQSIAWRRELIPRKHSLALIDDSVEGVRLVRACGPLHPVRPEREQDGRQVYKVPFRGPETLLSLGHARKFPGWPLLDAGGKPTGTYDLSFTGLSYGTIMKKLIQEFMLFPGGEQPWVFEPDRSGVHERLYEAIEGHPILDLIDDITELDDGVEYNVVPVVDEFDHISLKFVTGTDADRIIVPSDNAIWNLGGPSPDVIEWEPIDEVSELCTDAIFTGGKSADKVLAARASDSTLIDDGWPRAEIWDSSHSTVSVQSTLQAWADGALNSGYRRFNFKVRADLAHTLTHGDIVQLASQGHWDEPDGVQDMRVLAVSRASSDPDWVGVQLI